MQTLLDQILTLSPRVLESEKAACGALVRLRFPGGIRCPRCDSPCRRRLAHVTCLGKKRHKFTILHGTPFGTKLNLNVRALFIAIRAFSTSHRSISARELARQVGLNNHVTLWRHLHTLRALMPEQHKLVLTKIAEPTHVCCRRRAKRFCRPAWVVVGARMLIRRRRRRPRSNGNVARILGESVRTWINGTFHGVSARWLKMYLRELCARWAFEARRVAERLMRRFLSGRPIPFSVLVERTERS